MLKSSLRLAWLVPAAVLALTSLGCSGGSDPSADAGSGGTQEACAAGFLPLKMGVKWSYRVTGLTGGGSENKEQSVEALEEVPGKSVMAFRLRTRKGTGFDDETVSWQQLAGTQVVRYREQSFRPGVGGAAPTPRLLETWEPYKLRVDQTPEKLRQGNEWQVAYKETSTDPGLLPVTRDRNERWSVVAVNQEVVVPAGTYPRALVLRRVGTDQDAVSDKKYWFVCGVGKVKETGMQTEELTKVEGL